MPPVDGRYSNICAVDGYKPRDRELYYRVHRKTSDQKRSVTYSMCQNCFDAGRALSNEELDKL